MATTKKRRKRTPGALPGVHRRGEIYYWDREHEQMGRIARSFGVRDLDTANSYAGSLQKLMDRGDWDTLRRYGAGKLKISTIERAVREGDWQSLRKLHQSGPLLGEQADAFIARVGSTRREGTEKSRRLALQAAARHFGADRPMHTVTVAEAETYLHGLREGRAWSANTQASHAAALAQLWSFTAAREREEAEKFGAEPWLKTNPWRVAERPKTEQTRFSFFAPGQARELLQHKAVAGTPAAALLGCALYAGLRRGELAQLRTAIDVDLERGVLNIQSRGGEHEWKPKTKRGERRVPIIPALRTLLGEHAKAGYAGERYLFRTERADAPPDVQTVNKWARDAMRRAGVLYGRTGDGLTLHSCRHSFATWLLETGIPPTLVARWMGDRVETILRVYAHHLPDRDQTAIDLLQALAEGRPGSVSYHSQEAPNVTAPAAEAQAQ